MTLENFKYRTDPMFLRNQFDGDNDFGIPIIPKTELSEDDIKDLRLFPFNAITTDNGKHLSRIIHFFLYDYNFEKIWIDPDKYVDLLFKYKGVRSTIKMENKFESITDMKQSILWGGEVTFRVETGIEYGIFSLKNDDIFLAVSDGYKEKSVFEDGSDELHFKNVDVLLEYNLNGIPLKQVLLEAEITSRNL